MSKIGLGAEKAVRNDQSNGAAAFEKSPARPVHVESSLTHILRCVAGSQTGGSGLSHLHHPPVRGDGGGGGGGSEERAAALLRPPLPPLLPGSLRELLPGGEARVPAVQGALPQETRLTPPGSAAPRRVSGRPVCPLSRALYCKRPV